MCEILVKMNSTTVKEGRNPILSIQIDKLASNNLRINVDKKPFLCERELCLKILHRIKFHTKNSANESTPSLQPTRILQQAASEGAWLKGAGLQPRGSYIDGEDRCAAKDDRLDENQAASEYPVWGQPGVGGRRGIQDGGPPAPCRE